MVCANESYSAYNWHGFSYVEPCVCMWAGTRKRSENVLLLICMMGACHYYSLNYKPDSHTQTQSVLLGRYLNYIIRSTLPLFSLPMSAITGSVVSGLNRITWKYRLMPERGRAGGIWGNWKNRLMQRTQTRSDTHTLTWWAPVCRLVLDGPFTRPSARFWRSHPKLATQGQASRSNTTVKRMDWYINIIKNLTKSKTTGIPEF